jgi:hypothetical protein
MGLRSTQFFCAIVSLFFSVNLPAKVIILSDWHNTLVECRKEYGGTFQTLFKLFRIEQRSTTMQEEVSGPETVWVNHSDLHKIKKYLGKGPREPGALSRRVTLEDGSSITPGEYFIKNPESFEKFITYNNPVNELFEDFKRAEKLEPKNAWHGPFWKYMVLILSNEETAKSFGVTTAAGYSIEQWKELFLYLQKKGYIKYLPNFDLFFNTSHPKFDALSLEGITSVKKSKILEDIGLHLSKLPLAAGETSHTLIFADDEQGNVEAAYDKAHQLTTRSLGPVQYGIFNFGYQREIREAGRPQFSMIESKGTYRKATLRERVGNFSQFSEEQLALLAPTCAEALLEESK